MGATEDRVRAVQSAFDGRLLLALVAFNIMVAAFGAATLLRDRQRSEEEARATTRNQIGRASCRERVCYVV